MSSHRAFLSSWILKVKKIAFRTVTRLSYLKAVTPVSHFYIQIFGAPLPQASNKRVTKVSPNSTRIGAKRVQGNMLSSWVQSSNTSSSSHQCMGSSTRRKILGPNVEKFNPERL